MTSHQWLAMSRTERLEAECKLLHYMQGKPTLDAVHDLVLNMSALVQHQDVYGNNALHRAAHDGKAVPRICALIKEGIDPAAQTLLVRNPQTWLKRQDTHFMLRYLIELLMTAKTRPLATATAAAAELSNRRQSSSVCCAYREYGSFID